MRSIGDQFKSGGCEVGLVHPDIRFGSGATMTFQSFPNWFPCKTKNQAMCDSTANETLPVTIKVSNLRVQRLALFIGALDQ